VCSLHLVEERQSEPVTLQVLESTTQRHVLGFLLNSEGRQASILPTMATRTTLSMLCQLL